METLKQQLLECYPKLCIEKQTKPSYVEIYQKTNNDIAVVYSKIKQNLTKQSTDKSKKSESDEFELTGSPLKLDLSLNTVLDETYVTDEPQMWKKEEALHAPIESEKAREILNLYNKGLSKVSKEDALPMWVLCNSSGEDKALLIHTESNQEQFARGIVTYEGTTVLDEFDVEAAIKQFANEGNTCEEMVNMTVDCRLPISGVSYEGCTVDEQLNAPYGNLTELHCEWTSKSLLIPFISCKVNFVQEVIVGHLGSPCNAVWKSVSSLHNINQLLVDMTAAGFNSVNLETSIIRHITPGMRRVDCAKKLDALLNEAETYTYTEWPAGGCLCVTDDCSSLRQCLTDMARGGSSNDFTYRLWDILRDCETAEELITLFIQALKFVSSGKIRPFIDVNNKTYLSKLVLKLSRGHSQTAKVLKNLRATPPQALSLVAQVAVEKTTWEYTRLMSLLEHSFFIAGIWSADIRSHESIDQINQTIQDMTMGGELSLNPFESLAPEHSIRLDSDSFCVDDNELSVHDFASLKKHGLVADKKDINEVPLIADEIDISQWKHLLTKFAQIHVCLEHLYHAETSIRADFAQLKPIASRLLEYYVSDKSPVRTVGQLASDPLQRISLPVANGVVQDQLKKPASWYRMELTHKKSSTSEDAARDSKTVYLFSQQAVFPPPVWQNIEPTTEDVTEVITIEELKYHCTKYKYLCNKVKRTIELS